MAIKEHGESHSRFLIDIIIKTGTNVAAISGIYSMHALFAFKTYFNAKNFILESQYYSTLKIFLLIFFRSYFDTYLTSKMFWGMKTKYTQQNPTCVKTKKVSMKFLKLHFEFKNQSCKMELKNSKHI